MSGYFSVQDHRSLVFDDLRNNLYSNAIKNAINKDSVILDLGAGLGIHGFIATLNGAKKTYLVDPSPVMKITDMLAQANGLSENVTCIEKEIQDADLPEKVDIITSVFTGNFLLTEDLLPSLFYARDKYLRPGGKLIPDRATMEAVPVSMPAYYDRHINSWTEPLHEIDFSLVRKFAANNLYYDDPDAMESIFLAEPVRLLDMDFMTASEAACRSQVEVRISEDGLCHGWLGWFDIRLGDKWLSTSPLEKQTHWRQVFLPLAEPVPVEAGQHMSFELNRPEFGEWTWTVETDSTRQRQSTFLSEPLSPEILHKKSDDYQAALNTKGLATRDILQKIDGKVSTGMIAEEIVGDYPDIFPDQEYAKRFITKLIDYYC